MSTGSKILLIAGVAALGVIAVWKLGDTETPVDARGAALEPRAPATHENDKLDAPAIPAAPARASSAAEDSTPVSTTLEAKQPPIAADDCCIVGRVVDEQGAPIANATVTATAIEPDDGALFETLAPPPQSIDGKSHDDGSFSIAVPAARPFQLKAANDKLAPTTRAPVFAGDSVEMILGAGAVLHVRVRPLEGDVKTAPVGTRVVATQDVSGVEHAWWKLESDAARNGASVFHAVPAGPILVRARAPGFAPVQTTVISSGSGEISCELLLPIPGVIDGSVTDRASGAPISGAKVGCRGLGWTYTNRDGAYRIDNIEPSDMRWGVGASAPGYTMSFEYVAVEASGRHQRLDLMLDTAERAHGRVVDTSGAPIAGARVLYVAQLATAPFVSETHRGETSTSADGRFELADLHADVAYRVLVNSEGYGRAAYSIGPFTRGALAVDVGDFVLAAPASISGVVRCASDEHEETFVRLVGLGTAGAPTASHDAHLASSTPDTRGRFAFASLAPGKYRVELVVRAEKKSSRDERIAALAVVDLVAGEARANVDLECAANVFSGRVVDLEGKALHNCRVSLVGSSPRDKPLATTRTDNAGRFRIVFDGEGPFRIEVDDPRLFHDSAVVEDVRAGEGEIAVRVGPFHSTFTIRGRIVDASGEKPADVYVAFRDTRTNERLERVALPDEVGRFEMLNLRDVAYDLELMDMGNHYKPAKLANVKPSGEDVELRIEPRE